MKLENIETGEVRTVEIDAANMNAEVSKELGFPVECLDEWHGWFYFWRVGLDSDESDAVALLIK